MSQYKVVVEGLSIVVLGFFNPAIFHPAWFAEQELISSEEATNAKVDIVAGEVSAFSLEWLKVQVLRERFSAASLGSPSPDILRDFVLGMLTILNHTPVTMLGLNSDKHIDMGTEGSWHDFGHWLATPDPWGNVLKHPGLRSLTMEGQRPDDYEGMIRVKVEPSTRTKFGVYINVNDHYVVSTKEETGGSAELATQIIREQWKSFLELSNDVADSIFGGKQ